MRAFREWSVAGCLSLGVAISGGCSNDGDADMAEVERGQAEIRFVKELERADYARLLALGDGRVLIVSIAEPLHEQATELSLRAFDDDGAELWDASIDGATYNLPWGAPAVAISGARDIYLNAGGFDADRPLMIAGDELACPMPSCNALLSFDADGELRWVKPAPQFQNNRMVVAGDRLLHYTSFGDGVPVITAYDEDGEELWNAQPPVEVFTVPSSEGFAADGDDGFFFTGGGPDACGALTRSAAADGELTWQTQVCEGDDGLGVTAVEHPIPMEGGRLLAYGTSRTSSTFDDEPGQALGFDEGGDELFRTPLPFAAQLTPLDDASALLVPPMHVFHRIAPLAAIDRDGEPLWQWPGGLEDGELHAHPSGLCDASAVAAPDGELFVLTRACGPARALLGAELEGTDSELRDRWLLARVAIDPDAGYEPRCGNGLVDPGEACDGIAFAQTDDTQGTPGTSECAHLMQSDDIDHFALCTAECELDLSPCR